jgi:hypothetical protein
MTAQDLEQYELVKRLANSINMSLTTGSLGTGKSGIILWENNPVEDLHRRFDTVAEVEKFLEGYFFCHERNNRLWAAGILEGETL